MKNVTIVLEEDVAQWARIWAAKQNTSVPKLLGNELKMKMMREQGYDLAMRQYLSAEPKPLKASPEEYPDKTSLFER